MTAVWTEVCVDKGEEEEEELWGVLTCRTTPAVALLWLSHRAGQGGAGSSGREDRLSRTVPVTRVLHRAHSHHSSNGHCQFHLWLHVHLQEPPPPHPPTNLWL